MRAHGGAGNVCQFAFELDGQLDIGFVRGRAERVGALLGPEVPIRVTAATGDVEALFRLHWAAPVPGPESPVLEIFVSSGDRSTLLVRWPHARMDAPGADRFLQLLDGVDPEGFRLHDAPSSLLRRARGRLGWLRLGLALHALALRTLSGLFLRRPWAPEPGDSAPDVRFHTFDADTTTRIQTAGGVAGNHRLLAAAAAGVAKALGADSEDDVLVPCPVDLRPGGWKGPVLSNYVSTVVLRLPVRSLASGESAGEAVRSRFLRAIRRHEDAALVHLYALAGRAPDALTRALFGARDPSSLLYSNVTLEAGASGSLLGLPVLRALVAAQVDRPPGVCVMLSTCASRLTVAVPTVGLDGGAVLKAVVARIAGEVEGWRS